MSESFIVFADLPSWKVVKKVNGEKCLSHGEQCLTHSFKLGRSAYDCTAGISIGCKS